MNWQVFSRPEAENDVIEIVEWYDSLSEHLGDRFVAEFLSVLDELAIIPCCTAAAIRAKHPLALSKEFSVPNNLRS